MFVRRQRPAGPIVEPGVLVAGRVFRTEPAGTRPALRRPFGRHVRRELGRAPGVPHVPRPEPWIGMVPRRAGLLHQRPLVLLVYHPQRRQLLAVLFVHAPQRALGRARHRAEIVVEKLGRFPGRRRTGHVRCLRPANRGDDRPAAAVRRVVGPHAVPAAPVSSDQRPLAPRSVRKTRMRQKSPVIARAAQTGRSGISGQDEPAVRGPRYTPETPVFQTVHAVLFVV